MFADVPYREEARSKGNREYASGDYGGIITTLNGVSTVTIGRNVYGTGDSKVLYYKSIYNCFEKLMDVVLPKGRWNVEK